MTHNPHDKRYKELFSNKDSFLSLLKDCVKEPWVNDLDENSLQKSDNSFVLQDFSGKEADIIYEATINDRRVVFYVLLELQSTVDFRMPYRLLLYIVEILRKYYNQSDVNEREKKDFHFPVVFPIVFYSGSGEWNVPRNLKDMFSGLDIFGNYVLNFEYMLVDAKDYRNEDISHFSSKLLGLSLLLENTKNKVEYLTQLRRLLAETQDLNDKERRVLNVFIALFGGARGYNKNGEVTDLLDERKTKREVESMLMDWLYNEDYERAQAVAEGELKGELKGELRGKLETAKKMLLEKFSVDTILRLTGLSPEQLEEIRV